MNGKPAHSALEDLYDKILRPALAEAMGLIAPSNVADLRTNRAMFTETGISFEINVSTLNDESAATEGGISTSAEMTEHVVEGFIKQDLSVSFNAFGIPTRPGSEL